MMREIQRKSQVNGTVLVDFNSAFLLTETSNRNGVYTN
jgi:hypothetical protein